MRILIVSEDLPGPRVGGLGKHAVTLANALLAAGHHVDLLGRTDRCHPASAAEIGFNGRLIPGIELGRPGWKEAQLGFFNPLKRPWCAARLARAIRAHAARYDVVHYHGHLPLVGQYIDPAVNFVQTRHDQGSECLTHLRFRAGAVCTSTAARDCAGCAHPRPGLLRTALSARAVTRYRQETAAGFARHKTIFVSEFLRRQFLRTLPGADLSRCRVIHNFIDFALLAAGAGQAGALVPGQVLVAGRIDAGKGFGEFLAAARARLPPGARVLVVGDGPERAPLQARFEDARVRFLGWQPYREVAALTARSHACVVPSVWEEPFGTTTLEALALGRPCFALARGATPELACYQAWPGQLSLAATMAQLVERLADELCAAPMPHPPPAGVPMDVSHALPKILDFYAA